MQQGQSHDERNAATRATQLSMTLDRIQQWRESHNILAYACTLHTRPWIDLLGLIGNFIWIQISYKCKITLNMLIFIYITYILSLEPTQRICHYKRPSDSQRPLFTCKGINYINARVRIDGEWNKKKKKSRGCHEINTTPAGMSLDSYHLTMRKNTRFRAWDVIRIYIIPRSAGTTR